MHNMASLMEFFCWKLNVQSQFEMVLVPLHFYATYKRAHHLLQLLSMGLGGKQNNTTFQLGQHYILPDALITHFVVTKLKWRNGSNISANTIMQWKDLILLKVHSVHLFDYLLAEIQYDVLPVAHCTFVGFPHPCSILKAVHQYGNE